MTIFEDEGRFRETARSGCGKTSSADMARLYLSGCRRTATVRERVASWWTHSRGGRIAPYAAMSAMPLGVGVDLVRAGGPITVTFTPGSFVRYVLVVAAIALVAVLVTGPAARVHDRLELGHGVTRCPACIKADRKAARRSGGAS